MSVLIGLALAWCGLVMLAWCVVSLRRNQQVFAFRGELLDAISVAVKQDIERGRYHEWCWRYEAYDAVSYDDMVKQFWRPLEDFYPDRRFTDVTTTHESVH